MDILKNLRKNSGKTQQNIADILGLSQQAYATYETGTRMPPLDILKQLADFYHVSADYLLGRTNEKVEAELSEGIDPRFLNLLKENNISLESLNNLDDKKSQLIIDVIQNLIEKHK